MFKNQGIKNYANMTEEEKVLYEKGHNRIGILGGEGQERMSRNGWRMKLTNRSTESQKQFVERLIAEGYTHIKLYKDTGMVRGYHDIFAFVKTK